MVTVHRRVKWDYRSGHRSSNDSPFKVDELFTEPSKFEAESKDSSNILAV